MGTGIHFFENDVRLTTAACVHVEDIYLIEKASTKAGWSPAAPDENFTVGYQAELQDFVSCAAGGTEPQSGLDLAIDTIATIYAAYVSDEDGGREVAVPKI